eukprot:TRINITY_DN2507_c0_g2_i1.p1 TRINITY_DN2507_c0_g2~~TRINITY_DN2507_c0_g2_i1.p1  ORF type:complete len:154 (-),score=28.16 TRINITY_DN2507_c0_g2_i1:29-490(-)
MATVHQLLAIITILMVTQIQADEADDFCSDKTEYRRYCDGDKLFECSGIANQLIATCFEGECTDDDDESSCNDPSYCNTIVRSGWHCDKKYRKQCTTAGDSALEIIPCEYGCKEKSVFEAVTTAQSECCTKEDPCSGMTFVPLILVLVVTMLL